MENSEIIKRLKNIEDNARRLLEDTAALKEELSGGSDSSISKSPLSTSQRDELISNRHKTMFKKKE